VPAAGLTTRQLVDRYTAVVKASPSSPMAYDNLALAELQLAREDADPTWYGKAELLFNRALALNPKDFEALGGLGSLAASRHDFATALAMATEAAMSSSVSSRVVTRTPSNSTYSRLERSEAWRMKPFSIRVPVVRAANTCTMFGHCPIIGSRHMMAADW